FLLKLEGRTVKFEREVELPAEVQSSRDQIEGIACYLDKGVPVVLLGERESGVIHICSINWESRQGCTEIGRAAVGAGLEGINRKISDLALVESGGGFELWCSGAFDPVKKKGDPTGDFGPFRSCVYRAGTVTGLTITAKTSSVRYMERMKVEAVG